MTDLELVADDTLTLELISSRGKIPQHKLGRFCLSVSADPDAYTKTERRFAAMKMDEPWEKLAAAYHLSGDQAALDALLSVHPAAPAGIGDLYAAEKKWERKTSLLRMHQKEPFRSIRMRCEWHSGRTFGKGCSRACSGDRNQQ